MRGRSSWAAALCLVGALGAAGCASKHTYVVVTLDGTSTTPGGIVSIDLQLTLGTAMKTVTLAEPGGGAITLPTDKTLEITGATGALTILAVARDAGGNEVVRGSGMGDVVKDQTTSIHVPLGMTQPMLTVDNAMKDFGTLVTGTMSGVATFTVTNGGGLPSGSLTAALSGANASEFMIVMDQCSGMVLPPMGTCTVTARFQPSTPGADAATLTVGGMPGGSVTSALTGTAVSPGALTIAPSSKDFGPVVQNGTSSDATFTITNSGGAPTSALAVAISGSDAASFALGTDGCSGTALTAGGSCTVHAHFAPTTTGMKSASLTVSATTGGVTASSLSGNALAPGALSIMPVMQDFGMVVDGTNSAETIFTVKNTGGATTGALTTQLTGTDTTQFTITADACATATLTSMATCAVKVRFNPSSPGMKSATLAVGATPGGLAIAPLTGVGLTPGMLVASPAMQDAGTVVQGQSSSNLTVKFTNNGMGSTGAITLSKTGSDATEFVIDSTADSCSGNTLAPNAFCTVSIFFKPSLSTMAGSKQASLVASATPGGMASSIVTGTSITPAKLTVAPTSDNFGSVVVGGNLTALFTVKNIGQQTSSVPSAVVSGTNMADFVITNSTCTVALASMATCSITVKFTPASATTENASLDVSATTGGMVSAMLSGTGLTQGALAISPTTNPFASTLVGASTADASFTVQNTGMVATGNLSFSVTGTDSANFNIDATGTTCTSGAPLAAMATCTIKVFFQPVSRGAKSATLQVSASPGGNATSQLTGTGLQPAQFAITPAPFVFPNTVVAASSPSQTFTITNTGDVASGSAPSVSVTGANPADFPLDSTTGCGAALGANGSCTATVHFAPSASGGRSGTLQATATSTTTGTSALSGTGLTPAALAMAPTSKDFMSVVLNTNSADQSFTVSNTGMGSSGTLGAAMLTGTDAGQFVISSDGCKGQVLAGTGMTGSTCVIQVHFSPTTAGSKMASVQVTGAPGGTASATLTGNGITPAAFTVTPNMPMFGAVVDGNTNSITFTVQNTGQQTSGTPSVQITGTAPIRYSVGTNNCTAGLAGSGTCTFVVTFAPQSGDTGALSATLTVTGSPGSTVMVTLNGTAQRPAQLSFIVAGSPSSTATDSFGTVNVGSSSTTALSVTIQNTGDQSTSAIGLTPSGNTSDFSTTSDTCSGATLAGGAMCSVSTTFKPAQYGTRSASYVYSATTGGTVTLTATGVGQDTATVAVSAGSNGNGTVTSADGFINCTISNGAGSGTCAHGYLRNAAVPSVSLTATPDVSSTFAWGSGGACVAGTSSPCSVSITNPAQTAYSAPATFTLKTFTLSISKVGVNGTAVGTVTSSIGGINCGPTCSAVFNYGQAPVLSSSDASFQSFAIDCPGGGCNYAYSGATVTMTANHNVTATFKPLVNYIFVTAGTYTPGSLGGVAGADMTCATEASNAGLGGSSTHWKAYLSTTGAAAYTRLLKPDNTTARGWMRPDGKAVADTAAGLSPGSGKVSPVFYPPRIDAKGNDLGAGIGATVFTGTHADGTLDTTYTCMDWSSMTASGARIGDPVAGAGSWSDTNSIVGCNQSYAKFYCFQVDYSNPFLPPAIPSGGRIAFLSSFYTPGSMTPDAKCAADASAASLTGTFKAFIASAGGPMADTTRFNFSLGAWFRKDGVQVVTNASDYTSSTAVPLAPIDLSADGLTYSGQQLFWTGVPTGGGGDTTTAGTGATTCSTWATGSSSSNGNAGIISFYKGNWGDFSQPCNSSMPLMCLQL